MRKFLKVKGIRHQTTASYCPQQNGVAERANRTIIEKARCLLHDSSLNNKFWKKVIKTAVYLKNCSPSTAVWGKTPFEV